MINMLLKPTLFATLLEIKRCLCSIASKFWGSRLHMQTMSILMDTSTPYRPFQVMTNTQQEKRRQQSQEALRVVTWAWSTHRKKLKKLRLALSARQLHKIDHNLVASKHQHHNNNPFARISVLLLIHLSNYAIQSSECILRSNRTG